jgi:Fe-S cluster assembly iron-binding protein IscA
MLKVTEGARVELKKILFEKVDHPLAVARLVKGNQPDSYGLSIDIELPGDQVIEHLGAKVLLVDGDLSDCLDGNTLDIEDTMVGRNFVVLERAG